MCLESGDEDQKIEWGTEDPTPPPQHTNTQTHTLTHVSLWWTHWHNAFPRKVETNSRCTLEEPGIEPSTCRLPLELQHIWTMISCTQRYCCPARKKNSIMTFTTVIPSTKYLLCWYSVFITLFYTLKSLRSHKRPVFNVVQCLNCKIWSLTYISLS